MKAELREIDDRNRDEAVGLRVAPEQAQYISSNADSLKDAKENDGVARPYAVYIDGKMAGFTMFAFDEENGDPDDRYWLWRLMIDASLQGRGYAKAALKEIIAYFRENGADIITLSTKESNTAALSLYHQFGFLENGQTNGDEIVLKLYL